MTTGNEFQEMGLTILALASLINKTRMNYFVNGFNIDPYYPPSN